MPDGLDISRVESSLASRLIGRRIVHYDTLGSTMDEALTLAHDGAPEGTVIVAERQTAGRGRFQRAWLSSPGENLLLSVLLRPAAAQLPYLNMAASLAVSAAVASYTATKPVIKWPNDVLVSGKKISGILVETELRQGEATHAVVGLGLNVNLDPTAHPDIATTATSIYAELGSKVDRTDALTRLLEYFDGLYTQVKRGDSLTRQWAAELETIGRDVRVRWKDQILEGRAHSVDDQGNLVLQHTDGTATTVTAGEVTLQE